MAEGTGGTGALGCGGGGEPEVSDSLKTFGEVVKAFRKRAGLTQEEFAPRVRYSMPTVASIEQGRRFPPPDFVERAEEVLDAFGVLRGAARHLSRRPGLANSGGSGDCVEVALSWHKSSYSSGSEGDCVEVAACPHTVHVRDSKVRQGPHLALTSAAWTTFLSYATQA
ncbi:hypothetical protein SALBM311S_00243 [Streptomyces alboniger]